jgi:CHAT domain-containing protein
LLLGDGRRLSLFEIGKDEDLDFRNVDLLTLSACQTAIAAGDGSGREVESLGMLAQKKGARAVLATLWKVADEPTAAFMSEFYRLKNADPKLTKADAIRAVQLSMIQGRIKPFSAVGGCRAENFGSSEKVTEFKCDANAPFSHPSSWSAFVLIGNWR